MKEIGATQRIALALMCACAFFICATSASLAARPHAFKEAFGEPCPVSAEPCEGAKLKEPDGVAVSEASGAVYVVDKAAGRLVRFSEAGVFESELSGPSASGSGTLTSGSSTIEAALATTGAFSVGEEVSAPGLPAGTEITAVSEATLTISKPASASELATLSAKQHFLEPETIAVDNSCVLRKVSEPALTQGECEAEDPSNGDVYVVDQGHLVIDKFSGGGEYLGQISENESGRFAQPLDGVAVSRTGGVFVYQEDSAVRKYTNARVNVLAPPAVQTGFLGYPHPGFAIDPKGNFYFRYSAAGRIAKASPTGEILIEALDSENSFAVAVDQQSEDPAICNTTTVAVFDPEGTLLERLGEEGGAKHLSQCAGIGVSATANTLYVTDAASGQVVVFAPQLPSPPKVESESFSQVTNESAKLEAKINPLSEPGEAATEYHFQYGRCTSATTCQSSGYEATLPLPDAQIEADFEVHSVSVEVKGLTPGSTYHFRAIAKNSHGEGPPGQEVTFTTEGSGGELVLADNRGWELVSPPDKQGALIEPIAEIGLVQAAASGDAISYLTNAPTESQPAGYTNEVQVLSRRASAAWSSRDIAIAHAGATGLSVGPGPEYRFFDSELSTSVVQPFGPYLPLSEEASESTAYLHDLGESCASHCFRPLVTGKAPFANVGEGVQFGEAEKCEAKAGGAQVVCGPEFRGASDDLKHVVLFSVARFGAGTVPAELYEWSAGALSPVSVLPGSGGASQGTLGLESTAARGAISSDGTRIEWEAPGPALYTRDTSRKETVQLDAAQAPAGEGLAEREAREEASGGGKFQFASADGSRVLFTDRKRLSADSGAEPGNKADLYECKLAISGAGKLSCGLSDLTPAHGGEGADVQGGVLGASADGSYVYFVAKGVLSEAPNQRGQSAVAEQENLYVSHDGAITFIAALSAGDFHDWEEGLTAQPTRVSGNGQWLELMSQGSPTGYDNRDAATGAPVAEVYLYDAASGKLACASCEPSGARPSGIEYKKLEPNKGGLVGGPHLVWPEKALVGANVPGWTALTVTGISRHQPRYLSNEGRLFFTSAAALVPQDANATQDVYQYEPPGVGASGGCSEASPTYSARSGGCVSLISSGRSAQESAFLDASESGDDVFFLSSAKLSPIDIDTARDVYDAHVCSAGAPCISFPTVQSPPCSTEASCKASPTPQPSIFGAPASATFSGPGNPPPAPPGKAKAKTAAQIRAEHLSKALKACRAKKDKQKRKACEKAAKKKYGAKAKAKKQSSERKRTK